MSAIFHASSQRNRQITASADARLRLSGKLSISSWSKVRRRPLSTETQRVSCTAFDKIVQDLWPALQNVRGVAFKKQKKHVQSI